MNTYLTKIIEKKLIEINKININLNDVNKAQSNFKFNLLKNKRLSLIGEVKKASPSKGIIRESFNPVEIANEFKQFGASTLSVLTEKHYFLGNPDYIQKIHEKLDIQILRKDFIIDPKQIHETVLMGANAILLIKAILDIQQFELLYNESKAHGLDVLVEIHNEQELNEIKHIDIDLIGVNNRNLSTFETDLNTANSLYDKIKNIYPNACIVAESGYNDTKQLNEIEDIGFDAVLIGEGLATNPQLINYFNE